MGCDIIWCVATTLFVTTCNSVGGNIFWDSILCSLVDGKSFLV
jgi:hypothetical protein